MTSYLIQSLLLSIEAIESTRRLGEGTLPAAEESLRDTLSIVGGRPLLPEASPIRVSFGAGGRSMVTTTDEGQVRLWDLTRPWKSQVVFRRAVNNALISPNGRWLAETSWEADGDAQFMGKLRLWDLSARDPRTKLSGHTQQGLIFVVRFSPDGRWLAVGGKDGIVRLWDLTAEDPSASLVAFEKQQTGIWGMAISPDSRWLAVGSHEGIARLWDLQTDDANATCRVLRMTPAEHSVRSVAFSPDARWLATGGGNIGGDAVAVRLWDLHDTHPADSPVVLPGHRGEIDSLQFSPDGNWLVSGASDKTARRWNLKASDPSSTGLVLRHKYSVGVVAISPDSRWLLTAARPARLWNLTTKAPSPSYLQLHGHEDRINDAGFTADSRTLITSSIDGAVRTWDLSRPTPSIDSANVQSGRAYNLAATTEVLWGHRSAITWMEAREKEQQLIVASVDGQVRLLHLSRDGHFRTEASFSGGHMAGLSNVKVSHDGRWLALGNRKGEVHLWDLHVKDPTSDVAMLHDQDQTAKKVAFSPDNRWLTTAGSNGSIQMWDLNRKDFVDNPFVLPGQSVELTTGVAISSDNRWLAVACVDHTARVWDLESPNLAAVPLVLRGHQDRIKHLIFSADSRWLATGSRDHTVRMWDMKSTRPSAEPYVLRGHKEPIFRLAFSEESRWLATCGWTGMAVDEPSVRLWDLSKGQFQNKPLHLSEQHLFFHGQPFSRDGQWLATTNYDGTVRRWNLTKDNPSERPTVLRGHTAMAMTVAFSPDGRWLATGGGYRTGGASDNTLRLWDMSVPNSAASSVVLRGHRSPCTQIGFSDNSRRLITCSYDGTVRLWHLGLDKLIELARRTAGRKLRPDERKQYFPGVLTDAR